MHDCLQLLTVSLLSLIGYRLFKRLCIPAATIIGPLFLVAAVQMTGFVFSIPDILRALFSMVFGVYLGLRFTYESILKLKAIKWPVCIISVLYIGLTLFSGSLLMNVSDMQANTAFISVIPGGLAANSVLAASYGADLAKVSSFQLMRFLSVLLVVPIVTKSIVKYKEIPLPKTEERAPAKDTPIVYHSLHPMWLFPIGIVGSWFFNRIHFPAALMLGAAFSVGALQVTFRKPFVKPAQSFYTVSQIGIGAVIGISFTLESIKAIMALARPLMLITFIFIFSSIVLGYLFSKFFKWDFTTGYMAVLPGGLSAMIVLADELEADVVVISSMQLMRLMTAVMFIPLIYKWFL